MSRAASPCEEAAVGTLAPAEALATAGAVPPGSGSVERVPGSVAEPAAGSVFDEPLGADILADIATGIAAARPLWGAVVRHDADCRQPVRLLSTERYEVWVIGWTSGQGVELHDHGASAGTFVVTSGTLTEVLPHSGGPVERSLEAGRVRHVPVGAVHDVVNRAPEPATSIHVYSPPLTTMTYYEPDTLTPIATVPQLPEQPMLVDRAASFLLHPANRDRG
jgi:mannose-6-phosphate isomerase-like protein (cupin superfamily)